MSKGILHPEFVKQYASRNPMNMIGEVTYWRTYSRNLWDEGRKEQWFESAARVVNGTFDMLKLHCRINNRTWEDSRAERTAQEMFKRIYAFKFTPPGRGLFAMGSEAVEAHGGAVLNNCAFVSTRNISAGVFSKMMDLTMLGVGVGFDTRGADKIKIVSPQFGAVPYVIPDTRQGWVESTRALLESYMSNGFAHPLLFDYSQIRVAGQPIKRFGGVSSGPEPLIRMHNAVRELCELFNGKAANSTFIVDAANLIGRCVVSGNVRRSAQIALGNADDQEFLSLKADPTKVADYRSFSNNSILAHVGMDYRKAVELTATNGEPGYLWLDNARMFGRMNGEQPTRTDILAMGTNPCSEQTLEDEELCCLVETYPSRHATFDDYLKTLKLAYLYAKTVTLFKTGFPVTDEIIARNRRIGTSMSGVVQAIERHGAAQFIRWCDRGYNFLTGLDASYSDWLNIPESIKRTSVKPSGTVSILANVSPGIHYPHAEYYIRRIRIASGSPLLAQLERGGYTITPDTYGQEKGKENTYVVDFPIHEKYYTKGKADASMWEQMALAGLMQEHWADNQVSVTVNFKKEEARDLPLALEIYQHQLKSVSFLPESPEEVYALLPYQTISKEAYGEQMSKIKPTKLPYDILDVQQDSVPRGCDSDGCELPGK